MTQPLRPENSWWCRPGSSTPAPTPNRTCKFPSIRLSRCFLTTWHMSSPGGMSDTESECFPGDGPASGLQNDCHSLLSFHFHVHREPSRLLNPSVVHNETSCRPSPCGRLSRPLTTTTAPPLVRLVGETWEGVNLPGCASTLLGRASLVPLLTLKRPRLGFDSWTPNSGLLPPPRNIAG